MLKKIFMLSFISVLLVGCGNQNNTTQVSKIDSFISLIEGSKWVTDAKLVKSSSETRSNSFYLISIGSSYSGDDYRKDTYGFDLSIYNTGDSITDYYEKYYDKYLKNSNTSGEIQIPRVETIREYDLRKFTDPSSTSISIYGGTPELGDSYLRIYKGSYTSGGLYHSSYDIYLLEESVPTAKDLEKMGAFKEELARDHVKETLISEFGLSEDRGIEVSKMIHSWKKISNKRSMTNSDANLFSNTILGTDISMAESAYKKFIEGDATSYNELLEKASIVNGTSPEHMSELVEELLLK